MTSFAAWDMHYVHPYYKETTVAALIGSFVTFVFASRALYLYHQIRRAAGAARSPQRRSRLSSDRSLCASLRHEIDDGDATEAREDNPLLQPVMREEDPPHQSAVSPGQGGEKQQRAAHFREVLLTEGDNDRNTLIVTCVAIRLAQAALIAAFSCVTIWGQLNCCPDPTGLCQPPKLMAADEFNSTHWCQHSSYTTFGCAALGNYSRGLPSDHAPFFGDMVNQTIFCSMCRRCGASNVSMGASCPQYHGSSAAAMLSEFCSRCFPPSHIYALTPAECRTSALLSQYLFAAAYTTTCLFLVSLNFGGTSKRGFFIATHLIALITTLAMWKFTPTGATFVKYERTLPWCWIPDPTTRPAVQRPTLVLLQFFCEFVTIPVCLILGTRALGKMRAYYRKFSPEKNAVDRRLVPQVLLIVVELSVVALTRFDTEVATLRMLMLVFDSFLIPASGGITAIVWAYGDGILGTLVRPWRSISDEDMNQVPFSVIAESYRTATKRPDDPIATPATTTPVNSQRFTALRGENDDD